MKMMDVIVKPTADVGLELRQKPVPEVGPGEVLIKIHKTAICGTDVHIYDWTDWSAAHVKPGMTIGHEYVGEIAELGEGVTGLEIGQLVSGEGHIGCGTCRNCRTGQIQWCEGPQGVGVDRDGAFAEYLCIPESNVVKLDDRISDDMAAIMDPFGNATHTALSFPLLGEDVLITGAGLIGTMATAIAKFAGAKNIVVTDLSDYRLDIAKKMGATCTVNASKGETVQGAMEQLGIRGFDVGLEMSGAPVAFREMVAKMYNGSKIAQLGILPPTTTVDWSEIIFKALTIKGIYGREMWETWYKMEQMLVSGLDLSPVITHHFPIADFQKGFDVMESGQCGKVILDWE